MLENILTVTGSIFQSAYKLYKLRIKSVNIGLKYRSFALLLDNIFNLFLRLLNHFLNSARMNSSVSYQLFKRTSCNLTSYRVKSRKYNRLRRIVNYQIYSCKRFYRSNVSAFTADYSSLHFIIGKWND